MNFSVVILTLNEAKNIRACLNSLRLCDDIVVVDSFSEDRTCEIAAEAGCRIFKRKFDDFAGQRNWAMENIEFKHGWVFHLDADERFTPELAGECEDAVHEDLFSGYMVAGKLMFMGRWLKWAGGFPVYQMRFAKRGEIRYVQSGHGQREADALRGVGYLKYSYLHFPFRKGIADWYRKHSGYADKEARQVLRELGAGGLPGSLEVVSPDPVKRRRALKRLSRKFPCRPCMRFLYMYILKMGFLDGAPGFRYCALMFQFERMIDNRLKDLSAGDSVSTV